MSARVSLAIGLLLIASAAGQAQHAQPPTSERVWYESMPKAQRAQFLTAFRRVVSLRISRDWVHLFELRDNPDGVAQAQFEQMMNTLDDVLEFAPSTMAYSAPSESWIVRGCTRFRKASGKEFSAITEMRAYETPGGWRFGDVAVVVTKGRPFGIAACAIK